MLGLVDDGMYVGFDNETILKAINEVVDHNMPRSEIIQRVIKTYWRCRAIELPRA